MKDSRFGDLPRGAFFQQIGSTGVWLKLSGRGMGLIVRWDLRRNRPIMGTASPVIYRRGRCGGVQVKRLDRPLLSAKDQATLFNKLRAFFVYVQEVKRA
jgi:hypothetical protein